MRISDWSSDVCSSDLGKPEAGKSEGEGEAVILSQGFHRLCVLRPWADRSARRRERRATALLRHRSWQRSRSRSPRSEERRVGKECAVRVDLGGRGFIKKKKT